MDKKSMFGRRGGSSHAGRHLAAQVRSGLSVTAYCRKESISASTFYYWRHVHGKGAHQSRGKGISAPRFVEILGTSALSSNTYRVEFRNGRALTVPRGFVAEELRTLVAMVSEDGEC